DIADFHEVFGLGVDDLRSGVRRNIAWCTTQDNVVMRANGGTVRSTILQREHPGVRIRVEFADRRITVDRAWIDDQQPALAEGVTTRAIRGATRWVTQNLWDGNVKTGCFGIPSRLLDGAGPKDGRIDVNPRKDRGRVRRRVTVRSEQCCEG